jgi:hypothetical protein
LNIFECGLNDWITIKNTTINACKWLQREWKMNMSIMKEIESQKFKRAIIKLKTHLKIIYSLPR